MTEEDLLGDFFSGLLRRAKEGLPCGVEESTDEELGFVCRSLGRESATTVTRRQTIVPKGKRRLDSPSCVFMSLKGGGLLGLLRE